MDYRPSTFKLDSAIAEELDAIAKQEERTKTAIVERALREYINKSKAEAKAAKQQAKQAAQVQA